MKQDQTTQAAIASMLDTVTIPTLPGVVHRINALLNDPEAGMPEVAEVILQDASIAAKVLRMANSAFYGLAQPVVSIPQAALVLGGQVLRNIAMQASVMQRYEHLKPNRDFDVRVVWKHAVVCAQVCQGLGNESRVPLALEPDELYTCGLLHDIGKIVMVDSLGADYQRIVRASRERSEQIHTAESEAFGFSHADVGAMIAALWKLPRPVVSAIRYHHNQIEDPDGRETILLVQCADRIANAVRKSDTPDVEALIEPESREALGLTLDSVCETVGTAVASLSTIQV